MLGRTDFGTLNPKSPHDLANHDRVGGHKDEVAWEDIAKDA